MSLLFDFPAIFFILCCLPHLHQAYNQDPLWSALLNVSDETLAKLWLPAWMPALQHHPSDLSEQCGQDIRSTIQSLRQRRTWAMKFFDSWARAPPSGLFHGTLASYGDYDQCLSIQEPLQSQYCMMQVGFPMPRPRPKNHNFFHSTPNLLPENIEEHSIYNHLQSHSAVFYYADLSLGICMPVSCSEDDLTSMLSTDLSKIGLELKDLSCQTKSNEAWKLNLAQTIAIIWILVVGSLSVLSIIYDYLHRDQSFLRCFSPLRNISKLMSTKQSDDLSCIHGLRFITIVWIIMGHSLEWNPLNVFRDTFTVKESLVEWSKQPLLRAHLAVETFLYISGLLTSFITLKYSLGEYKNFSYAAYLLFRYLRLTPQLASFMLLTSLLPLMFDGPLWVSYSNNLIGECPRTWWHNLIYLQTIIDVKNICAIHTWFLAADMQLHWLALIPIVLMFHNRKFGLNFCKILVVAFTCVTGIIIYQNQIPPGFIASTRSQANDEENKPGEMGRFFFKTWNHINVFFIGFIFGAYLHSNRHRLSQMAINKTSKLCLWAVAISGYLFGIYYTSPWMHGRAYDPLWSSLLYPLSRVIWALALTALIWLCVTGNGLVIGRLLSWRTLQPLSRMTFSVYLVHAWVFTIVIGTRRQPIEISIISLLCLWCSIIVGSYLCAFVFAILFESPFINMMSYLKQIFLFDNNMDSIMKKTLSPKVANEGNKSELLEVATSEL